MKKKITAIVESGKGFYSCFAAKGFDVLGALPVGDGKTVRDAMKDFYICIDEIKEWNLENGKECPDVEVEFRLDVGAFFNYYPLSVTAFAKYIGMNPSLLRQYVAGIKEPKGKTLERIRKGIESVTNDINAGLLIDKPVLQYV